MLRTRFRFAPHTHARFPRTHTHHYKYNSYARCSALPLVTRPRRRRGRDTRVYQQKKAVFIPGRSPGLKETDDA